jgi:hypothetical protein
MPTPLGKHLNLQWGEKVRVSGLGEGLDGLIVKVVGAQSRHIIDWYIVELDFPDIRQMPDKSMFYSAFVAPETSLERVT